MNLLRSLFIALLIPALLVSNIILVKTIFDSGLTLPIIGALMVSLPFLLFFIIAMFFQNMARTSKNLTVNSLFVLLGMALVGFSLTNKNIDQTQLIVATIIAFSNSFLFLVYIFWYSKLSRETSSELSIGKILPVFQLYQSEQSIGSTDFLGKPTVIMFYRGNWCPFCVAQIKELVAAYKEAIQSGIQIILVSPQPDKNSESLAKKFDVPFRFLRDKDNQAAKLLGIFHENGLPSGLQALGYDSDTVLPTVIKTDKKGVVNYLSLTDNYRVRPDAKDFLNIVSSTNEGNK